MMDTRERNTIFCIVAVMLSVFWFQNAFGYQINLNKQLNLISLPEQPANTAIDRVTSSIAGKFNSIWAYVGGSWKLYNPGDPNFSDLLTMEAGQGYWIDMKESGTLSGTGTAAPSSISLSTGWNLIGYNATTPAPVTDALGSISGKYDAVWAYTNGAWKLYDPQNPNFSDLTLMEPGAGYWVQAIQSCTIDFSGLSGTTISPSTGGIVSTGDGASVSFPADFGSVDITVSFSKAAEASGVIVEDRKIISAEYSLQIANAETISSNFYISLPVDKKLLPSGVTVQQAKASLRPEVSDTTGSTWTPVGSMITYDEKTGIATFDVSSLSISSSASASIRGGDYQIIPQGFDFRKVSLARLTWRMYSATVTLNEPPFKIHYYPPEPKNENSIPIAWKRHTEGDDYNFIDDLFNAAMLSSVGLTSIKNSDGSRIFVTLSNELRDIEIYVVNTGADSGVTPLGGPVVLSNTNFLAGIDADNWSTMRTTVAHELVHFYQGPIYGVYESSNRWFIEATAQYYASRVAGFDPSNPTQPVPVSDQEKKVLYGGDTKDPQGNYTYEYLTDYLSVSITSSDNESYYALGHFLEWLEQKYGVPITADVLSNHNESEDKQNLTTILNSKLGLSIGDALEKYIDNLMVNPEALDGFNKTIKERMAFRASGFLTTADGETTTSDFRDNYTFKRLKNSLELLSARYLTFSAKLLSRDSLLVIDCHDISQSFRGNMKSFVYAFSGDNATKAAYDNNPAVDDGIEFPFAKTLTIPNFGGTGTGSKKLVEHMMINKDPDGTKPLNVGYYILMKPNITQVGQGTTGGIIVWKTNGIGTKGGIPVDYIKGYDVYDKSGKKLNKERINLPSIPGDDLAYEDPSIDPAGKTPDDFTVVIVDQYDNSWPEVKTTIVVTISPKEVTLIPGGTQTFTATVTGTTNTAVTWSVQEGSAGGTITTTGGVYTAPNTPGTYHVVATSQADPTKFATATVTVTVKVIVSPISISGLSTGEKWTFTAKVFGTTNTSVTWSVQEGSAGGTITSGGVYTAPCNAGTYHVVATSQADPTISGKGTVKVDWSVFYVVLGNEYSDAKNSRPTCGGCNYGAVPPTWPWNFTALIKGGAPPYTLEWNYHNDIKTFKIDGTCTCDDYDCHYNVIKIVTYNVTCFSCADCYHPPPSCGSKGDVISVKATDSEGRTWTYSEYWGYCEGETCY